MTTAGTHPLPRGLPVSLAPLLRRCVLALLLVLGCAAGARAELPAPLAARLEQIFRKGDYNLDRLGPTQWLDGGAAYAVLENLPQGRELARYGTVDGVRTVLIPAADLPRDISEYRVDPSGRRVLLATNPHGSAERGRLLDYSLYDVAAHRLDKVAANVEDPRLDAAFSPDGGRLLYVLARNIVVRDIATGRETRLTSDGVPGAIGNGVADWASGGPPRWSPDGRSVAFIQVDERAMTRYPILAHTEADVPDVWFGRYPLVGTPIGVMRLGIVSAEGKDLRWPAVPHDAAGDYLDSLDWDQSGAVLVQHLSRGRDRAELYRVDPASAAVTRIVVEQDPAWVRDSFADTFGYTRFDRGRQFLWLAEHDGWRRAWRVSADGTRWSPITPPEVDVISALRIDEKAGLLYYIAAPDNPAERLLYRARLDGRGHAERVTPPAVGGTNRYDISPDGRFAIHTHHDAAHAPVTELVALPGHAAVRLLVDNRRVQAAYDAWARPPAFARVDIGGGVQLDAWIMRPQGFDPKRKYPVFVHVYGEPALQNVVDSWGIPSLLFHQSMAEAGYIVVSIDNRGTPAPKGSAWRRAVFGSLGPLSTEEQAAGLRALAKMEPAMDLARVGIWGWSAGGTNTLNAMFREPDLYSVGIAVAPKPRPDLYNAGYQEIFMRTPAENPDGYRRAAAINYAEGLKGHLLIVTGSGETNTHFPMVEQLVSRLVELNKPFDFMEYPGRNHDLSGGNTNYHVFELIARYMVEKLPPVAR